MDAAVYDSTDNLIIAVRGGRVFQCDAATGVVLSQLDFQQLGLGGSCIVWDQGTNRCFASCWNTGNYNVPAFAAARNFYRIVPNPLSVDLVTPLSGIGGSITQPGFEAGIIQMKNIAGTIYGIAWDNNLPAVLGGLAAFKFLANNIATHTYARIGGYDYPSFAYATVGGNDRIYTASSLEASVQWWDFVASGLTIAGTDVTRGYVAIEYAPVQQMLYVTREFQFIDIYDTSGVFQSTLNTARAAFNGVNIQFNPNDGFIYVAGGADGSVIVIDPATNAMTVKTGFDLPWSFVFTPSAKFAVQQGATGLKAIT